MAASPCRLSQAPAIVTNCTISVKAKTTTRRSRDQRRRLDRRNVQPLLTSGEEPHRFYPKSSPTPLLLLPRSPDTITRNQAVDYLLDDMEFALSNGVVIDTDTFSSLLDALSRSPSASAAVRLRRLIPRSLLRRHSHFTSKLIKLHAASGLIETAHHMFDEMPSQSVFAWNSLISGYVELGLHEDAMALYYQMEEEGVEPDGFTFPRVLKAVAGIGDIRRGEEVHRHAVRSGLGTDSFVLNALVDMYSKCGDIWRARCVFDRIENPDSVSWNSMLVGYISHGLLREAVSRQSPETSAFRSMLGSFEEGWNRVYQL